LEQLFNIPATTPSDQEKGKQSHQKSNEAYQTLSPAVEHALEQLCIQMDEYGFLPRLYIFNAMAQELAKLHAEEEGDAILAKHRINWLREFLNRHPALSAHFASNLDRQQAFASNPGPIQDDF
jgi:hypothetical protein